MNELMNKSSFFCTIIKHENVKNDIVKNQSGQQSFQNNRTLVDIKKSEMHGKAQHIARPA